MFLREELILLDTSLFLREDFLAPTGAQEVTIFVRLSSTNLSEALNLHHRALREQSDCVILVEPKTLCLVFS